MVDNLTLINADEAGKKGAFSWEKLALVCINGCSKIKKEREKQILMDRFGIGKSPKTLNAIGKSFNVTRERIRQIVNNAIKKIKKYHKIEELTKGLVKIEALVKQNGGYLSNEDLFEKMGTVEKSEQNALKFVASLSENINFVKDSNTTKAGWIEKSFKESKLKELSKKAVSFLKERGEVQKLKEISAHINEPEEKTLALLSSAKQ